MYYFWNYQMTKDLISLNSKIINDYFIIEFLVVNVYLIFGNN